MQGKNVATANILYYYSVLGRAHRFTDGDGLTGRAATIVEGYFEYTSMTSPTKPSLVVRLFVDDCILYCSIKTQQESTLLQTYLNSIAQWELTWQMKFNIDNLCYTKQAGRTRHNILNTYTLHHHPLPITDSAKYLGITVSNNLKWNTYK